MRGFFIFFLIFIQALPLMSWASEDEYRNEKKYELTAAVNMNYPFLRTSYRSEYSTPFMYGQDVSSASQILNLEGRRSLGVSVAFNYFPHQNFGLQILLDYFKSTIEGENDPYELSFEYTAYFPPSYIPQQVTYESSLNWPDTEGHLKQLSLSLNGIGRFIIEENISASLSAGLSYFQVSGRASSLGYSKFWLGGHSVLFNQNYQFEFSFEPTSKIGINVGGEVSIDFSEMVCFAVGYRYFYCSPILGDIHLEEIINEDEIIRSLEESFQQVEEHMNLEPAEINPSFGRIHIGLKFKF
jgi:hypothetical protein